MNTRGSAVLSVVAWLLLVGWVVLVVVAGFWASPDSTPFVSPGMAIVVGSASALIVILAVVPRFSAAWAAGGSRVLPAFYRLAGIAAAGAVALVVVGFKWHLVGSPMTPPPDSLAVPALDPVAGYSHFEALRAYAKSLTYDDFTHGTADSGYLADDTGRTAPIKAWIAPAQGADFIRYEDIDTKSGNGRVVARITVDTAAGRGYETLGLPAGVSYLWVDHLEIKDTTGTFRAFIIPDRPGAGLRQLGPHPTFIYLRSHSRFANFPMARWLLHGSSCFNTSCSHGCCRVCP
jgi:hypothetical protein